MKAWDACNSLDWVTCFPLHFTLAYIVYRESQTRQVVYIHVHFVPGVEWTVCITPRQRVAVRAHEKSRGREDFVKSALCGLYCM